MRDQELQELDERFCDISKSLTEEDKAYLSECDLLLAVLWRRAGKATDELKVVMSELKQAKEQRLELQEAS